MDIPQTLKARAVILLGKGMTLRDHAQGAWRMRGLETLGQTLELWIVPEVGKLIDEAGRVMDAKMINMDDSSSTRAKLHWVMRWLISNTLERYKL